MNKNETFTGEWLDYFNELEKYVTHETIGKNRAHFELCLDMCIMPCRAVRFLEEW